MCGFVRVKYAQHRYLHMYVPAYTYINKNSAKICTLYVQTNFIAKVAEFLLITIKKNLHMTDVFFCSFANYFSSLY